MAKKNIDDQRELLFSAIEGVKDGTLDIEKAKVIGTLSQVMVNSAAVEVKHAPVTGQTCAPLAPRTRRGAAVRWPISRNAWCTPAARPAKFIEEAIPDMSSIDMKLPWKASNIA